MNDPNKQAKLLGCKCDGCPLAGRPIAWPEPVAAPKLAIFAEGPGRAEERLGRPLVGQSGWLVNTTLSRFGISRNEAHVSNALLCRPDPEQPITPAQWRIALRACSERVLREVRCLPKGTLVILLGGRALQTFTGHKEITRWRGYPVDQTVPLTSWGKDNKQWLEILDDYIVFPTWHPAYILRKPAYLPGWLIDWQRALSFSSGALQEWSWPDRIIHEGPLMVEALRRMQSASSLGVDIEGSGLDPFTSFIRCIGVADDTGAVSVPWEPESPLIRKLVTDILADPAVSVCMHNGNFDMIAFKAAGIEVNGFDFDTLVAHHEVARQMGHDLGLVASLEFPAPRWKSLFKVTDDRKGSVAWDIVDPEDLRRYNCGDAIFTHGLRHRLESRLRDSYMGVQRFSRSMEITHINRQMAEVGVQVDQERREQHRVTLTKEAEQALKTFREQVGQAVDLELFEGDFNPASTAQLRSVFFDHYGCRPRYRTDGGLWAINAITLEEIIADGAEPEDARTAARLLLAWRGWKKLLSTYVEGLPISQDGRVHPNWKKTTLTDRHNSSEPNMQNVPKGPPRTKIGMRDMFVAQKGSFLVAADYGQLEARIQAHRAGELALIDKFNNDPSFDYHGFFATRLFGVDPEKWDPQVEPYKGYRQLTKQFNFGDNYGAAAKTIWKQIVIKAPHFTVKMVEDLQAAKAEQFQAIARMKQADMDSAYYNGWISIPFGGGRFYYYLQRIKPTQLANVPIQGGAAAIINPAMVRVAHRLRWPEEAIVAQIHDELLLRGPDPQRLVDILCEEMPQVIEMDGYSMTYPISASYGTRWSELKDLGVAYKGDRIEVV